MQLFLSYKLEVDGGAYEQKESTQALKGWWWFGCICSQCLLLFLQIHLAASAALPCRFFPALRQWGGEMPRMANSLKKWSPQMVAGAGLCCWVALSSLASPMPFQRQWAFISRSWCATSTWATVTRHGSHPSCSPCCTEQVKIRLLNEALPCPGFQKCILPC